MDDIESAGRVLRQRRQHVIPASIVLRHKLYVILFLKCTNHIWLGCTVPTEHVEFDRIGPRTVYKRRRKRHCGAGLQERQLR